MRSEELWSEVCTMVGDLGWAVVRQDDAALELTAKKPGNLLGGGATVVFRVEGPAGLPSSQVNLTAESSGLLGGAEGAVKAFTVPFTRRVC